MKGIGLSRFAIVAALTLAPTSLRAQDTVDGGGAQQGEPSESPQSAQSAPQLTAAQVFALADQARARRDFATAETAYRALQSDPDPELRTEARFRLGLMLADDLKRYTDAPSSSAASSTTGPAPRASGWNWRASWR